MRQVLAESSTACQTDTVEGEIEEWEFQGNINMHMTSKLDIIANRWVPVLMSITFGRTALHFETHWRVLFESLNATS